MAAGLFSCMRFAHFSSFCVHVIFSALLDRVGFHLRLDTRLVCSFLLASWLEAPVSTVFAAEAGGAPLGHSEAGSPT